MSTRRAKRSRTPAGRPRATTRVRRRLAPADRRRELVRVAGAVLTRDGVDGVQFARVAAEAGVTRPLVYKFFRSRQELIIAVLEDFAAELAERFGRGAMRSIPGSNAEVARVFVEAVCDTIEQRGAGPWHLLDAKGPDPLVARRGQEILESIVAPWQARIASAAGTSEREAATLARMIVAAGRAVLELWCNGLLTREEAVRDTTRGVTALVGGFARGAMNRSRRPPRTARFR